MAGNKWLDGPRFVEWIESKRDLSRINYADGTLRRQIRRWRSGENMRAQADGLGVIRVLDELDLYLWEVPEECYTDTPRNSYRKVTETEKADMNLMRHRDKMSLLDIARKLDRSVSTIQKYV